MEENKNAITSALYYGRASRYGQLLDFVDKAVVPRPLGRLHDFVPEQFGGIVIGSQGGSFFEHRQDFFVVARDEMVKLVEAVCTHRDPIRLTILDAVEHEGSSRTAQPFLPSEKDHVRRRADLPGIVNRDVDG